MPKVSFEMESVTVEIGSGQTIWHAAQKAGTITADQATQLKANLTTREQQFVDSNRPGRGFPFGPGR